MPSAERLGIAYFSLLHITNYRSSIDNRVFWTAIDKTYQYANKKK